MARAPSLSYSRAGLSPFKRTGSGFSVFNVTDTTNEAYLAFTKVNVAWQQGTATDEQYLTALKTYADSFGSDTADYYNAQERYKQAVYDIARNKIIYQINKGTATYDDLLNFDTQAMVNVDPGNAQYRQLQGNVLDDTSKSAYATFDAVRQQWQAGKVNDSSYLAAFQTYVNKLSNPTDKANAQLQLQETQYTLGRNELVEKINTGKASVADLLVYDQSSLNGISKNSDEYNTRLSRLQETQRAVFSQQEQDQQNKYNEGKMTTAQLIAWYKGALAGPLSAGNQQLDDAINQSIESLTVRQQGEKDTQVINDFNNGNLGVNAFLAYAKQARDRYASGTPQYQDWSTKITDATRQATEDNLLYRYGLTQQYDQLKQFVQTHKDPPWTKTGSSTITWKYDGTNWIPSSTGTATTPTPDEQAAWAQTVATVKQDKALMRYVESQIATVPGGWMTNDKLLTYYQNIQKNYVPGSSDWYQVQNRIDSINNSIAQENVWKTVGITISYPSTPGDNQHVGSPPPPGTTPRQPPPPPGTRTGDYTSRYPSHQTTSTAQGSGISIDQFLAAVGSHESNNNYNAQNWKTGAYGKYQILPGNWPSWSAKAGLGGAPPTPENQEIVAKFMIQRLYDRLGDWRLVALAWHAGHAYSSDPNQWTTRDQKYVNRTMMRLGSDMWTPTTTQGIYANPAAIEYKNPGWTAGNNNNGKPPPPGNNRVPDVQNPPPGSYGKPGYNGQPPGGNPPPGTTTPGTTTPGTTPPPGTPPPVGQSGPNFLMRFAADGSGHVVATGIPTWATTTNQSGSSFESNFYNKFQAAFRSGATSVTIFDQASGKPVTYYIPDNAAERSAMMAHLDQIRQQLYYNMAAAYTQTGNTDAANVANDNYDKAVHDGGINQLTLLNQQNSAYKGVTAGQAATNPDRQENDQSQEPNVLAQAQQYADSVNGYVKAELGFAQAAYDKGDYTAAYNFLKAAQQSITNATPQMNAFKHEAATAIAGIQGNTGAELPGDVATALDKLNSWDTQMIDAKNLSGLHDMTISLFGTNGNNGPLATTIGPNGQPVPKMTVAANGPPEVVLNAGYRRVFNPDGTVKPDFQPPQDPNVPPTMQPDNTVPVTAKIGNTVETVYVQVDQTNVGAFSDGTPIQGNRAYDPISGRYVYEDPFNPGHWSITPINVTLPPNAWTRSLDPSNPQAKTIFFTVGDTTYAMQPGMQGSKSNGTYNIGQWDQRTQTWITDQNGNPQVWNSTDPNRSIAAIMQQGGLNRNSTNVSASDRMLQDTTGPVFGMTGQQYNDWLNIKAGIVPPTVNPYVGTSSAYNTGVSTAQQPNGTTYQFPGYSVPPAVTNAPPQNPDILPKHAPKPISVTPAPAGTPQVSTVAGFVLPGITPPQAPPVPVPAVNRDTHEEFSKVPFVNPNVQPADTGKDVAAARQAAKTPAPKLPPIKQPPSSVTQAAINKYDRPGF